MAEQNEFKNILKAGDIFFIPLDLDPKEKANKSYTTAKFSDEKVYAYGRFIENRMGGGLLIEVFDKIMKLKEFDQQVVVDSGRLFPQILVSGLEFEKKRWRKVDSNEDFDKFQDSNYKEIYFITGGLDNLKLKNLYTKEEKPIDKSFLKKYEESIVYNPVQVENRIRESL